MTTKGVWDLQDVRDKLLAGDNWDNVQSLYLWGQNEYGALGQNNRTHYSSPLQISGSWSELGTTIGNENNAAGVKTDGTLWVWGYNGDNSKLGLNAPGPSHKSSPTQIPGTTWERVELFSQHSGVAQRTDGTVWVWGLNNFGQLGQNNLTNSSSPVQLTGTAWRTFTGSKYAMAATKDDGTLWTWGNNYYGSPGTNNTLPHQKSSPVQVGAATNWSSKFYAICGSENYSMSAITVT